VRVRVFLKDPEEYEERLPVVKLLVEEFECRLNRNIYDVACTLDTGETLQKPFAFRFGGCLARS
jgi:hypothetical protein